MAPRRLSVLLTCHNRVDRTLRCLASLFDQDAASVGLEVTLVDAGSFDGTAGAVARRFPQVTVLERGPDLFWTGGMREAWAHAYVRDPDLYLWLNDDVELDPDAIAIMLDTHERLDHDGRPPCIVVGSTRDPTTGAASYGGVRRPHRHRPLHYALVPPGGEPRRVETMNGNIVLVPRAVVQQIGTLAACFTHGMGDYDYGHRAVRAGCEVWIAPGTLGTCARNPPRPPARSLAEQRRRVTGVTTGLPPREWFTFARRWGGPLWPIYGLSPYIRRFLRWGRQAGRLRALIQTALCSPVPGRRRDDETDAVEVLRDEIYLVDPAKITLSVSPFTHGLVHDAFESSFSLAGVWDRFCTPYRWHPVVLGRLRVAGVGVPHRPGSSESRHRRSLDRRRRRRYRTPEDRRERIRSIDDAIDGMRTSRYREQTDPRDRLDEIGVYLTRDGRLTWGRQGDHRLTIAQALEIPRVSVILRGLHRSWVRTAIANSPELTVPDAVRRGLSDLGLNVVTPGSLEA
jgi:GT2 family glycosyltransferase